MAASTPTVSQPEEPEDTAPGPLRRAAAAAVRPARAAWSWCATGPVSLSLAALLVLARVIELLARGSRAVAGGSVLAAPLEGTERPWALLTAWMGTGVLGPLIGAVALLTAGVLLERYESSRRFALAALVGHVIGVGGVVLLHPALTAIWPTWGQGMEERAVSGVALLLAGALGGASELMGRRWRWRSRLLLLGLLALVAAVTGTASEVARLLSALAGTLLGAVAWRSARPSTAGATARSSRSVLAVLVTGWSLTMGLSVISKAASGPLSGARIGLAGGEDALSGIGSVVLALMPVLLQLALAEGLRRGRRTAAIGTIALQVLLAVTSVLSVATGQVGHEAVVIPSSGPWLVSSHLALPLVLNLLVVLLVAWTWRELDQRTSRGVLRRALGVWAATAAVCAGAAVVIGLADADGFSPEGNAWDLFWDYVTRLLPSSAEPFLAPQLIARSVLAHVAVQGMPAIAWLVGAGATLVAMLAPTAEGGATRDDLKDLVRSTGAGSLGWMLTWPGNEARLSADGRTGFAYRTGSGVALTLSDPACAAADVEGAVDDFTAFCRETGLIPALYSVHEPAMRVARARGWTVLQVAEEAVVDLPDLAFKGKAFQDVRTALNHASREGITAVWTSWREAPEGRRDQIRAISRGWAGEKALPEMGFTLGGLAEIDDDETRLLLAVDEEGTVHAVTSWMPVYEEGELVGLTLDVMRKRDGGWRPSIEYLIARAAQDAQAEGLRFLSLSGAPLAHSPAPEGVDDAGASRFDPLLDLLAGLLEPAYGFGSLHSFKRKFKPRSVPMYLAVPDVVDLPTVGLAIARAYVPDITPAQAARFAQVLVSRD
ncbi:DUF2156 domain-containing protein [Actinomyces radicidentis]|uniref:bifunctional lysylphosphatidylglycerol flippase/synthetase MprF n=1 Tax=Actinomyces radicidentis TaxID=111015 RepID=UPI0028E63ED8|nr:DUF2156 domain-containing protein [Actinomyces radicidentis]